MEMALKRATRSETPLGVLMVDLDYFKEINDLHGHYAGDKLLCGVADRLLSSVRASDTVARYGGDEFIILLPDLRSADEAEAIASKIIAAIAAPINIGVAEIVVTLSLGVCTYPDAGTTIESLLQCADAALYRAKANGRNGFDVFIGDREQTMP
jgi:diguanylate cyclase (GGDEF)-like protein